MSSSSHGPDHLEDLLEEYSLKLDDYKRKFNPFFSQMSLELKEKVDQLRFRIEKYANYSRDHQLKHLLENQRVQEELCSVFSEFEEVHSKIKELEKMYLFKKNLH